MYHFCQEIFRTIIGILILLTSGSEVAAHYGSDRPLYPYCPLFIRADSTKFIGVKNEQT